MFDNTDTYTGQLKLDLTDGKLENYHEELQSKWFAVDVSAEQKGEQEPAALTMTATRLYNLERIN